MHLLLVVGVFWYDVPYASSGVWHISKIPGYDMDVQVEDLLAAPPAAVDDGPEDRLELRPTGGYAVEVHLVNKGAVLDHEDVTPLPE